MTSRDSVGVLSDRLAINDLVISYARGVDRRDWPSVEACFAPEAYVAGTRMQAPFAEYFPFLQSEIEKFDRTTHLVANHSATISGDRANAETYTVALHFWNDASAAPHRMAIAVRYADELERRDRWRIVRRSVVADWVYEEPNAMGLPWTLPPVASSGAG
jgi:hypothetical protein